MDGGWQYRVAGVVGTAAIAGLSVALVNHPMVQDAIAVVPVLGTLRGTPGSGWELLLEAATAALVVTVALGPLYRPRPRRILDVAMTAARRTTLAVLALATIGYFDYSYRLPRATLIVAGAVMLVAVPAWFVAIRRRPTGSGDRVLVVGDDPATMDDILAAVAGDVVGYVSPPSAYDTGATGDAAPGYADGGADLAGLANLGGLSRLDEILVDHDVDTAVLAFARPDRAEFFGTLDTCFEHGVAAKVHRDHADAVLTRGVGAGELVDIDLEPWDPLDHVVKRAFDLAFAVVGLVVLAPVSLVVAAALKLEDGGPVLYSQERTAAFGDTFTVYKFRTMTVGAEQPDPTADPEDDRVTAVGRVLRRTHLDEIPQLLAILRGDMSVVGPRAVWTDEEHHLEAATVDWRKRWFVRPGLTGLAQINDVTSTAPEEKLRYDVEYIRRQSFWFDLRIVVRQLWIVLSDIGRTLTSR